MLETILELPGVDVNKPDNEGNTPLHFAAQAGKIF
jgi:ankyrin repeat protein